MANLPPDFDTQFIDAGEPAAGYKLYTYETGTTTPKATYSNQAGTITNTNPITLDAEGRCSLWLGDGEYTLSLYTATIESGGSLVRTWSDVSGVKSATPGFSSDPEDADLVGFSPTYNYAVGTIGFRLAGDINPKDFPWLAKGDGVTDDSAAINACIAYGAANGGARVLFDVGDYFLGASILLMPAVDIMGKRRGSWDSGDAGVQFIKGFALGSVMFSSSSQTLAGCHYQNFWIHGHKEQFGFSGCGIEIGRLHACTFSRIWVRDCGDDGFLIGSGGGLDYHNYFYNCYAFFCGGDGYNIKSDWLRLIDSWADGNKNGVNVSGGSYPFIERFHAEEYEEAAIYLSGTNGVAAMNATIRDPVLFSRPYDTAWRATGIRVGAGSAGAQVLIENPKITFQSSYAALGTQAAIEIDAGALDVTVRDAVEVGFSTAIRHGTVNRLNLVQNTFNSPIDLDTDVGDLYIERNRFVGGATITATGVSAVDNDGYANNSSWTPVMTFGGANVGMTGTFTGKWTQNGKRVFVSASITLTAKGSSTGTLEITGLPAASTAAFAMFVALTTNTSGLTGPVWGYLNATNQKIYLNTGLGSALNEGAITNTTTIQLSFDYEVA